MFAMLAFLEEYDGEEAVLARKEGQYLESESDVSVNDLVK